MATIRLPNLRGLDPKARRRIRQALRAQPEATADESTDCIASPESNGKWRNVRTTLDGIALASKREAKRTAELKIELLAGEITDLELQRRFRLDVNGVHICDYVADFVYRRDGVQITEDAEGKATDLYRIKRALIRAIYGIDIIES